MTLHLKSEMKLIHISYFYSTTKHEIIQIKKSQFTMQFGPAKPELGCFDWLAHYKRIRIVKNGWMYTVQCTF